MAFTYDPIFAADPNNAANVASNASIIIFDPNDVGKAPITIADVTGSPLANPITVNKNGFGPAFQHATLDRVGWFGAGFTGYFTSYEGMKNEATDAKTAAQNAASTAGTDAAAVATAAIGTATDASTAAATSAASAASDASASATAAANAAALVGAPADNAIAAAINGAGTATKTALNATYAPSDGPRPKYLDATLDFFLGPWVTGQGATSTTLTAQANAGSTTLAVTSGASFPNNAVIITNAGTATQQQYKVTAGGGTASLTVTPAVVTTLANGTTITPLWTNTSHLTAAGHSAFYRWILQAPGVFTNPGAKPVVLLGNSWGAAGGTEFAAAVAAKLPGATATNTSVSGNTSADLLARFDADVPANAAYVIINEPGVNDILTNQDAGTMAANLAALVQKIRKLGATPVVVGPVPLSDMPAVSAQRAVQFRALDIGGASFPNLNADAMRSLLRPQGDTNTALGKSAQANAQGTNNTGVGSLSQRALTTGGSNTAFGADTQKALTTGAGNTAVGQNAQAATTTASNNTALGQAVQQVLTTAIGCSGFGQATQMSLTTGNNNTAVGTYAQGSLTTGQDNTAVGARALYSAGGDSTKATIAGSFQTAVGVQSGQAQNTNTAYLVAIGYRAQAGINCTAIGSKTFADGFGSVAIGMDSDGLGASTSVNNEIMLGTVRHTTKIIGRLNVAPRTPTSSADVQGAVGDIATDDNYVYVKTSTGWKRSALTTF